MNIADHSRQILSYPIASGEMHYMVQNERAVYLQEDSETSYRVYGKFPGGSRASSVNLAEVFLEFAMSWDAPGDSSEARRQMQIFGTQIGDALADRVSQTAPVNGILQTAAQALEDVFRSLDASFAVQQTQSGLHYKIDQCPLRAAAEVTGLGYETGLAHEALNAVCQSLVNAIAPELQVHLPDGPNPGHIINVVVPSRNGR